MANLHTEHNLISFVLITHYRDGTTGVAHVGRDRDVASALAINHAHAPNVTYCYVCRVESRYANTLNIRAMTNLAKAEGDANG